ncbi:MAG TPA: hypothetical protein VFX96_20575 [Pyrinomonadaceae bacterium]|nr:hypothetical protein [Pyrinomonadaceae bacterium]
MQLSTRLAAFALALAVGSAAWNALAAAQTQDAMTSNTVVTTNSNMSADAGGATPRAARTHDAEGPSAVDAPGGVEASAEASTDDSSSPSVKWSEVQPAWGTTNVSRVTLRESSSANSPIVATLELPAYDSAEILDWTRERVKVKFAANADAEGGTRRRDYEGWVAWNAMRPGAMAVVLDAETGEVFARVPLSANLSSATFSPDGRRVLFHGGGSNLAYEASVKDFKPTRVLESTGTGGFGTLFYGADGELRAPVWTVTYHESGTEMSLDVLRVGAGGAVVRTRVASKAATKFLVAPEGKTAVLVRGEGAADAWGAGGGDASMRRATVEVLDLDTLSVVTSFVVYGADAPDEAGEFALSRDGTQLYVKGSGEGAGVAVFDTRSGGRVRDIQLDATDAQWSSLASASPVGGALLMSVWRADEEHGSVQGGVWLGGEKPVAADEGVDFVVEAGGARYAVNSKGTQFLKLDEKNRVRERLDIERPDRKRDAEADDELMVYGLVATPDAKHLIIFVGMPECGC